MLPHQAAAWADGLFSTSAEFEATPKSGSTGGDAGGLWAAGAKGDTTTDWSSKATKPALSTAPARRARIHWCARRLVAPKPPRGGRASELPATLPAPHDRCRYVLVEAAFVCYGLAWACYFWRAGEPHALARAAGPALAVLVLCAFYGDDRGGESALRQLQRVACSPWRGLRFGSRKRASPTAALEVHASPLLEVHERDV